MFCLDRFPKSTSKLLSVAFLTTGAVASLASVSDAQLRTGRGTRELYVSDVPQREIVDSQEESKVALASSEQPITRVSATREAPPKSSRSNQVSRASNSRVDSQRTSSTAVRPQPVTTAVAQKNQAGSVVQAGCQSCGNNSEAPVMMDTGNYQVDDGSCDSCASSCCGNDEFFDGGPMVIDLGCGPLARVVGWLTQRSYVRFNAASFDQNGLDLPILATRGTAAQDGFRPATPIAFGGNTVNDTTRVGYRFQVGIWLDSCQERAIEVRGYDAGSWNTNFLANTTTIGATEVLARPVFASNTATQDRVLIVASNRSVTGGFTSSVSSQAYGGDILLRRRLGQNNNVRWDLLMGYQGNRISDNLSIYSQSNDGQSNDELRDSFVTRNQFDGMAIGLGRFSRWCNWSLDGRFKLGMGNLRRETTISGSETINNAFVRPAGLLARATNSDTFIDDTFVVSPELSLDLGYALTRDLDFTIGYNYLSLPKVARAGDQISRDSGGVPITDVSSSSSGPSFNLQTQSYWLQSFNFGAQWRY